MTAVEGFAILSNCFMLILHLIHLALSFYIQALTPLEFHWVWNSLASLVWIFSLWISIKSARTHVAIDYRFLTCISLLIYGNSVYTFFSLYGIDSTFPDAYYRMSTWTLLLQLVLAGCWFYIDCKRAAAGSFSPDGPTAYQALPSSGTNATLVDLVEDTGRTWISIFLDTCAYTWPTSPLLQLNAIICILLLIGLRVLNLAVPIIYKSLVDILAAASSTSSTLAAASIHAVLGTTVSYQTSAFLKLCEDAARSFTFMQLLYPWTFYYLLVVFFQGGGAGSGMGIISNLRSWLWISVSQDAYKRISLRVFNHMVSMDIGFHLQKKTGEVQKVVNRGTDAMQTLLSSILFSIAPQLIDVLIGEK